MCIFNFAYKFLSGIYLYVDVDSDVCGVFQMINGCGVFLIIDFADPVLLNQFAIGPDFVVGITCVLICI